jgi:hypothetical protein
MDDTDPESLKRIEKYGVLVPDEEIPEGIDVESFLDVYVTCFKILKNKFARALTLDACLGAMALHRSAP